MYRSKQDVDKHVESLRSKLSLKEFNVRAYSIARLYFVVGDYASCQKYVEQYINAKGNDAASHKLLGQCFQKLGRKEKALEEFQIALNIDPTQSSLILEICELLSDNEVSIDPGRAKYWCDRAEAVFPKHPIIFRLREFLVSNVNPDPKAMTSLLKSEIETYPKDVTLHVRLLKHYLHNNEYKEALEHTYYIEFNSNTFYNNLTWYETVCEVVKHQPADKRTWHYNFLLLTVLERLSHLSLLEIPLGTSKSLVESHNYIHQYDQALAQVTTAGAPSGFAEFHLALLHHHHGQLTFHCATYILKKAKKDQLSWRNATSIAAPLILMAWHTKPEAINATWLGHAPDIQQACVRRWYLEGSFRCSQSGHYLLANVNEKSDKFLDKVAQGCSNAHWKDKMYRNIFTNADQQSKISTSHFVSKDFGEPALQLPRRSEVETFDSEAQRTYPTSLHHCVWILMNYKKPSIFKCTLFEMLSSKAKNYPNCGPETLNKLDIIAFLHCSNFTAMQVFSQNSINETDRPKKLPANITDMLCSMAQMKWWECAYRFSQNELGKDLTDIRTTLSRGIEVVRCVDKHGLDPELLCKLGRIYSEYCKRTINSDERLGFEQRATLYYSCAIPLLEKIKKNIEVNVPEHRLFDYTYKELNNKEIAMLLEECKLFIGSTFVNSNEFDKAIDMLDNLKCPKAKFYLCQIFKQMALDEYNFNKDEMSSETKAKTSLLLIKAKKYAYKSLNKLKDDVDDSDDFHEEAQEVIEEIETYLHKLDYSDIDGNVGSDGNVSPSGSELATLNSHVYRNSTPKRGSSNNVTHYKSAIDSHFIDNTRIDNKSFDKIDNQIGVLQKRDATISNFMDQTKNWIEENRNLGNLIITSINTNMQSTIDQFRLLTLSVDQVKDQIAVCKTECKDVGDLKKEVEELKKEINKLKKMSSDTSVDDRELYEGSSLASRMQYPNHIVPSPFNQRLMPPFPMPPSPYHQLYNQNLYNLYNQYSQFPQPPTVPVSTPIFDPTTRSPVNFQGLPNYQPQPQPHDHLYAELAQFIPPPLAPVATSGGPSTISTPKPIAQPVPSNKDRKLPVNVVITSSQPLPTCTATPAPVLSVTIPREHIKQTVHNYQIDLQVANENKVTSTPIISSSTPSIFSPWGQPATIQALVNNTPNLSNTIDKQIAASNIASNIFNTSDIFGNISNTSQNGSSNKSRTLSERSNTSVENYDPYFTPIISLPDEVPINTGEEDETPLFCARAKLFRFVEKDWKERGIGEIKLLKNKTTGKVRVLMRREQIFKICANHLITPELKIQPMNKEKTAYIWVAHDFSEGNMVLEKLCARFKTFDIATQFYETFEKCRKETESIKNSKIAVDLSKTSTLPKTDITPKVEKVQMVGGFTFSGTPSFKNVEVSEKVALKVTETNKTNLFSNFTFKTSSSTTFENIFTVKKPEAPKDEPVNKLNTSDIVEEYEAMVDFKPVISLPALVDHRTGEEDEIILFEYRAKLLRFDTAGKEWKERGLGNIKVLAHKDNDKKVRLIMRRDQVMKVCCNHSLTKDLNFQRMPNTDNAVTWCAKDFVDGELVPETFCLRFKASDTLNTFLEVVKTVQSKLNDIPDDKKGLQVHVFKNNQIGFGDNFKPKENSWYCQECYTNNLDNFDKCACCEVPKPTNKSAESNKPTAVVEDSTWGDKFKPKPGSWECKECYVLNDTVAETCPVCSSPRDQNIVTGKGPIQVEQADSKFSFGIPDRTVSDTANKTTLGWGEQFKPKAGSWECENCLVRNESNANQCLACNTPKDPSVKQEPKPLFGSISACSKFSFGIPQKEKETTIANASIFDGTGAHKFTFGLTTKTKETNETAPTGGFNFTGLNATPVIKFRSNKTEDATKPALLSTPQKDTPFGITSAVLDVKPKSSPNNFLKKEKVEDSDDGNEYASEDDGDHIHFDPVIPMPDMVPIVTGEEQENTIFDQRAQLLIFSGKVEWKECGRGNVKILEHKDSGRFRVLMRREKVHKVCLNHALTPEITYTKKDEKSWVFAANDFSEGEIRLHSYCIRFQKPEMALNFKNIIDVIQKKKVNSTADNDDVIFVEEIRANSEDRQKAKDLLLPENFFLNYDRKPCAGCRGCEDEQVLVPSTPVKNDQPRTTSVSSPNSVYGTPAMANKTLDTSIFRTPLHTIGQNAQVTNNKPALVTVFSDKENSSICNIFGQKFSLSTQNPPQANSDDSAANSVNNVASKTELKPIIRAAKLPVANNTENSKSILSTNGTANTNHIFGTSLTKFGSGFGFSTNNNSENEKPKTVFGSAGSIFGNVTSVENRTEGKVFGDNGPLLGSAVQQPMLAFSSLAQKTVKPEVTSQTKNAEEEFPLRVNNDLSFSALSSETPQFNKQQQGLFTWEGTGQQIFSSTSVVNMSQQSTDNDTTEDYDPHYEPIVPLPDEIMVSTGEEEEEKLYGERAKLYRFSEKSKEWKERGVGELKILYHPQQNTYRLLLRREQVYKAVLNTLIYADMELRPMNFSSQAWTWNSRNYAENPEGEQETLAIRFKNIELAKYFRDKVVECTRKLQAAAAQALLVKQEPSFSLLRLPKSLEETARADHVFLAGAGPCNPLLSLTPASSLTQVENASSLTQVADVSDSTNKTNATDDESEDEDDEGEYDEYCNYDENYDEDEESTDCIMEFAKCKMRITPGYDETPACWDSVHVQILSTQAAPKIMITDMPTGEILTDMIVEQDMRFELIKNTCSWTGQDFLSSHGQEKTICVTFPNPKLAIDFYDACETGKALSFHDDEDISD